MTALDRDGLRHNSLTKHVRVVPCVAVESFGHVGAIGQFLRMQRILGGEDFAEIFVRELIAPPSEQEAGAPRVRLRKITESRYELLLMLPIHGRGTLVG